MLLENTDVGYLFVNTHTKVKKHLYLSHVETKHNFWHIINSLEILLFCIRFSHNLNKGKMIKYVFLSFQKYIKLFSFQFHWLQTCLIKVSYKSGV